MSRENNTSSLVDPKMALVAKGQKIILCGILLYLFLGLLHFINIQLSSKLIQASSMLFAIIPIILLCVWGAITLLKGMEIPLYFQVPILMLLLVPGVGFIVLIFLNKSATKRLALAGIKVGLLGAKRA